MSRELSPQRDGCRELSPLYPQQHHHGTDVAPESWWLQRGTVMRNEGELSRALKDRNIATSQQMATLVSNVLLPPKPLTFNNPGAVARGTGHD